MKKELHPKDYKFVVYKDSTTGDMWLTKSTASSKEIITYTDGKEYPLISVHISSKSHPFFTGSEQLIDVEGRVDKFKARQEAAKKLAETKKTTLKTDKVKASKEVTKLGGKRK